MGVKTSTSVYLMDGASALDGWAALGDGAREAIASGWVDRGEYRLSVSDGEGGRERIVLAPSIESLIVSAASVLSGHGEGAEVSVRWLGPMSPEHVREADGIRPKRDVGFFGAYANALSDLYIQARTHLLDEESSLTVWDMISEFMPTATERVEAVASLALPSAATWDFEPKKIGGDGR